MSYWAQFSIEEIDQMHGKDNNYHEEEIDEEEYMDHHDEAEEDQDRCPRCGGGGCNWCLMLDY